MHYVRVGVAVALVGVCVSAPPANASQYSTVSIVKWGGEYCMWMKSPSYGNYWAVSTDYVCDTDHQLTVNTPALSGQWVGVDPVITTGVAWAGCSIIVNGKLDFADYAQAGDGHDVNCLRLLN